MMRSATFTLDIPPSTNQLYATAENGRRVKTASHREWKSKAAKDISAQAIAQRFQPLKARYSLTITASDQGLTHARDADNLAKAISDAFVKASLVHDDNHRYMRAISVEWSDALPAHTCSVELAERPGEAESLPSTPIPAKSKRGLSGVMLALRERGINVPEHRVHVQ